LHLGSAPARALLVITGGGARFLPAGQPMRAERAQALYSVGLYALPWFAARFLSGELPGLFLMGRVVFRCAAGSARSHRGQAGA